MIVTLWVMLQRLQPRVCEAGKCETVLAATGLDEHASIGGREGVRGAMAISSVAAGAELDRLVAAQEGLHRRRDSGGLPFHARRE